MADLGPSRNAARAAIRDSLGSGYRCQAFIGSVSFRDHFSDGNVSLDAHTPDSGGGSWTNIDNSGTLPLVIQANRARLNTFAGNARTHTYRHSTGATDGYLSFLVFHSASPGTDPCISVGFRAGSSTGVVAIQAGQYQAVKIPSSGLAIAYLSNDGDSAGLALYNDGSLVTYADSIAIAASSAVRAIEVRYIGTSIKVWMNGTLHIDTTVNDHLTDSHCTIQITNIPGASPSVFDIDDLFITSAPSCPGAIDTDTITSLLTLAPIAADADFTVHYRWNNYPTSVTTLPTPTSSGIAMVDDNGGVIRNYQTTAISGSNGYTSFSLSATSDGTTTGTARAGMFRPFARLEKTGGVDAWFVDSEGGVTLGTLGASSDFGRGYAVASTTCTAVAGVTGPSIDKTYRDSVRFAFQIDHQPFRSVAATRPTMIAVQNGVTIHSGSGGDWAVAGADFESATDGTGGAGNDICDVFNGTNNGYLEAARSVGVGVGLKFSSPAAGANNGNDPYFVFTSAPAPYAAFDTGVNGGTGTTGHGDQVRSSSAGAFVETAFDANPAIFVFKDAALTLPGVLSHQDSARTITQDIFKRAGAVNATNAIPYLSCYVVDADSNPIASQSFVVATLRTFDSVAVDTQTITSSAAGRLMWNHTIAATAAAFTRYVKIGTTRQPGSHVATGPDNPASAPAYFSLGNGDRAAPFPGYPRNVRVTGNIGAGVREPARTTNTVFGVNSEPPPDDVWSGPQTSAQLDANGVPNGPGSRQQTLGAGSLKTKASSLINEGTGRVIDITDSCIKDIAGRDIDLSGAESFFLRRALFNDTSDVAEDPGTNLNDGQTSLDTNAQFGYHSGNNSLDTVAAPVDGATFKYYLAGADTSTQRTSFALTVSGADPVAGFTQDVGNFFWFEQILSFASADLTLKLLLNCEVAQSDPTVPRRFTIKVMRRTQDNTFADAAPDSAPLVAVFAQGATGPMQILEYIVPTPIGAAPTPNWEFTHAPPIGYSSVKYVSMAKVSGSDTPSGSESTVQIGFEYDGVGSIIKILQSA